VQVERRHELNDVLLTWLRSLPEAAFAPDDVAADASAAPRPRL